MSTPEQPSYKEPQTPAEAQKEFERLFAELVDVLQETVEAMEKNPERMPVDLELKVSLIEQEVAEFQRIAQEHIDEQTHPPKEISELTLSEQASIDSSKRLLEEAKEKQKLFPQQAPPPSKDISNAKDRRKHFKRLGRKRV